VTCDRVGETGWPIAMTAGVEIPDARNLLNSAGFLFAAPLPTMVGSPADRVATRKGKATSATRPAPYSWGFSNDAALRDAFRERGFLASARPLSGLVVGNFLQRNAREFLI